MHFEQTQAVRRSQSANPTCGDTPIEKIRVTVGYDNRTGSNYSAIAYRNTRQDRRPRTYPHTVTNSYFFRSMVACPALMLTKIMRTCNE